LSKFCNKCGAENKDNSTFCSKCGRRLDHDLEIDDYKILLNKAIKNKKWEDVSKYSEKLDFIDADDYDSIFYIELAEYHISSLNNLDEGDCLIEVFGEVTDIIKKNKADEIGNIIVQYSDEIYGLIDSIESKSKKNYAEILGQKTFHQQTNVMPNATILYLNKLVICINLLTTIINYYHEYSVEIKNDEKLTNENFDFTSNLLDFLKKKNIFISIINHLTDYNNERFLEMEESTTEEIKEYDSSYSLEDDYDSASCDDYCENCGEELREEDDFCPNCGHKIYDDEIDNGFNTEFNNFNSEHDDEKFTIKDLMNIIIIAAIVGGIFLLLAYITLY